MAVVVVGWGHRCWHVREGDIKVDLSPLPDGVLWFVRLYGTLKCVDGR